MEFADFFLEEEELNLFTEGLLGSSLRALGGFGGNLLSQTASGVGNVAVGAGKVARGLGRVGLGAAQGMTGGGSQAKATLSSAGSDIASGVGRGLKGMAQGAGALTGFTPTIRALQASGEKGLGSMSSRRTGLQKALGLNSWDPEGDFKIDTKEEFEKLKDLFRLATKRKDKDTMRKIKAEMERVDPEQYRIILTFAKRREAESNAKRWKKIVGDKVVKPEDYLKGLSGENTPPQS